MFGATSGSWASQFSGARYATISRFVQKARCTRDGMPMRECNVAHRFTRSIKKRAKFCGTICSQTMVSRSNRRVTSSRHDGYMSAGIDWLFQTYIPRGGEGLGLESLENGSPREGVLTHVLESGGTFVGHAPWTSLLILTSSRLFG